MNFNYEILAPVGNFDMLYAAISAGANAVYLAGPSFGARAYADNFNYEDLEKIVRDLHFYGMNVYITVNTVIKEKEVDSALEFINFIYSIGVDGVIIQDLGLYGIAKEYFKDLHFHASTQLSTNNYQGTKYLEKIGFNRVTLAREVSLEELEEIRKKTDIELEVFVHGSNCVSYSGKCLMSSNIGGRSGNRGRCAQPCRKNYSIYDKSGRLLFENSPLLSPKDTALRENIIDLKKLKIDSFKIEGRMKRPEYVYGAVSYYKNILEGNEADHSLLSELSKRPFTRGHLYNERGRDYSLVDSTDTGSQVGKTTSYKNKKAIIFTEDIFERDGLRIRLKDKYYTITAPRAYKKGEYLYLEKFPDAILGEEVRRISRGTFNNYDFKEDIDRLRKPVSFNIRLKTHESPYIEAESGEVKLSYSPSYSLEKAKKAPLKYEFIEESLSKLGDSKFYLEDIRADFDEDAFISKKDLNELRRNILDDLELELSKKYSRQKQEIKVVDRSYRKDKKKESNFIIKTRTIKKEIIDYFKDYIIISENIDRSLDYRGVDFYYCLSPINSGKSLNSEISFIRENLDIISGLAVFNAWEIDLLKENFDLPVISMAGLNVFNSYTVDFLNSDIVTLSTELSIEEIRVIRERTDKKLAANLVYKDIEMVMKYCPMSIIGCNNKCEACRFSKGLTLEGEDDIFSFYRENDLTIITRKLPYSNLALKKELSEMGIDFFTLEIDDVNSLDDIKKICQGGKAEIQSIRGNINKEIM